MGGSAWPLAAAFAADPAAATVLLPGCLNAKPQGLVRLFLTAPPGGAEITACCGVELVLLVADALACVLVAECRTEAAAAVLYSCAA